MKNRSFLDVRLFLLACTITSTACGQPIKETTDPPPPPVPEAFIPEFPKTGKGQDSGLMRRNELNAKAVRNFTRTFKETTDATWFKSANGLTVAYFATDKFRTWAFYNDDGGHEYTLRHYGEGELPPDVRHTVKSKYYDFSIYHVSEITKNDKIGYTIHLEDKKSWKTVRVVDGEMELIQELNKSQIKRTK